MPRGEREGMKEWEKEGEQEMGGCSILSHTAFVQNNFRPFVVQSETHSFFQGHTLI